MALLIPLPKRPVIVGYGGFFEAEIELLITPGDGMFI